jgi:hypothetical protein
MGCYRRLMVTNEMVRRLWSGMKAAQEASRIAGQPTGTVKIRGPGSASDAAVPLTVRAGLRSINTFRIPGKAIQLPESFFPLLACRYTLSLTLWIWPLWLWSFSWVKYVSRTRSKGSIFVSSPI